MRGRVEFRRVTKSYGAFTAVSEVSFAIEPGTLVTLLGPSGCGKTTTLRMIAGLELASDGKIEIGGRDVTKVPATDRDVTMVFQSYALFPHMNVLENVMYGLTLAGRPKSQARGKALEGLSLVGLEGLGERLPSALSGGQQQRVAVARALVLEPEVLLFDEPLSNLDAKLRRKMREDIRELQKRLGVTAVYVTHDQEEALSVSDKIVVMDKGRIIQEGTPRELYEHPASLFIATFIGDSNVVEGQLSRSGDGLAKVDLAGFVLELAHRGAADGRVKVAIRPHAIALAVPDGEGAGIPGTVRRATYLGGHVEYSVDTPLGELFVVARKTRTPLAAGTSVRVALADEGVTVVP